MAGPLTLRAWRRPLWWALVGTVVLAHAGLGEWVAQRMAEIDPRLKGVESLQAAFTRQLVPTEAPPPVVAAAAPAPPAAAPKRRKAALPRPAASAAAAPASAAAAPASAAGTAEAPASAPAEAVAASAVAVTPVAADSTPPPASQADAAPPPLPPLPPLPPVVAAASVPEPGSSSAASDGPRVVLALPVSAAASARPAAAAGSPQAFDWPASTRLRYRLQGYYRGDMQGDAEVRWLRQDERYQVHLDVRIGAAVAPLMSRRMASDGRITAAGLEPQRFEQVTKLPFTAPQALQVQFDADEVQLARGARVPRPAGTQDVASQFVQLIYVFRTRPGALAPGGVVSFPLALPHRVGEWRYEVVGLETLTLPAGTLEAFHLRPINVRPSARELTIEMWFAPRLQYLPVRLMLRQDADTWADLTLEEWPQQAAPASSAASGN